MKNTIRDSEIACSFVTMFLGSQNLPLPKLKPNLQTIFEILKFSFQSQNKTIIKESISALGYFLKNIKAETISFAHLWIFGLVTCINLEDEISIQTQKLIESESIFDFLLKDKKTSKKVSKVSKKN
jgi:hypothetical protein